MPIINKKFERQNIFFFDERKDLKKRTALKNKCNYLEKINQTTLKKNNITHCILCFDRSRSYQYSKLILNNGINLFAEKPVCSTSKELKELLSIAKRKKSNFISSFQRAHDKKIIYLKQRIEKLKINFLELNCNFYSGNFRHRKKTKIRTLEKLKNLKTIKSENKISYLIFLNRYWHIINAINFLYPFVKSYRNIKQLIFSIKDRTNYALSFKLNNKKFKIIMNSEKKIGWHEFYCVKFKKKKIFIKLDAPMKFNKNEIEKTSFFSQINFFFAKKNKIQYKNIKNCIDELRFIEYLWKKNYLK